MWLYYSIGIGCTDILVIHIMKFETNYVSRRRDDYATLAFRVE